MTLDEIRKLLQAGALASNQDDVIASGKLPKLPDGNADYTVHCGWDIVKALACDEKWGRFNVELLSYIEKKYSDAGQRQTALEKCSLEDHHWDWFSKAARYTSKEYRWFFLYSEGKPQSACLVYHPKQSALCSGNIFYIEGGFKPEAQHPEIQSMNQG